MAKKLSILRMEGKDYFIDRRLNQIRNVKNPHDYEDVSPELIDFWENHCRLEGDELVCNLDNFKNDNKKGTVFS